MKIKLCPRMCETRVGTGKIQSVRLLKEYTLFQAAALGEHRGDFDKRLTEIDSRDVASVRRAQKASRSAESTADAVRRASR
jgi:hypothetical protein